MSMFRYRDRTWLALIVVAVGLLLAAILGLFGVHERHCDAAAPERRRTCHP